jgi:hypothetical protein
MDVWQKAGLLLPCQLLPQSSQTRDVAAYVIEVYCHVNTVRYRTRLPQALLLPLRHDDEAGDVSNRLTSGLSTPRILAG